MDGLNGNAYASQNLYVQPPTRQNVLDDKSNLVPRGRSRGPLLDGGLSLSQLDRPPSPSHSRSRSGLDEPPDPPRPPPPRPEGELALVVLLFRGKLA